MGFLASDGKQILFKLSVALDDTIALKSTASLAWVKYISTLNPGTALENTNLLEVPTGGSVVVVVVVVVVVGLVEVSGRFVVASETKKVYWTEIIIPSRLT